MFVCTGMLYLHQRDVIHGDVHTGNALLYRHDDELVAKWTDFGLGYVGSNKQYRFRRIIGEDMNDKYRTDILGMSFVFGHILSNRHLSKNF